MGNNIFYYAPNDEQTMNFLLDKNYRQKDDCIFDISNSTLTLVLNTAAGTFWVVDHTYLQDQQDLAQVNYGQSIIPTTLKEMKLWLN